MDALGTRRAWLAGLALTAIAGAALRWPGLAYGLPAVYNPDEIAILNRALALGTGDLSPHNFVYPTFYFYALLAWEGVAFVAASAFGVFQSLADFQRAYFVDPSWHYLTGRLLTLLTGVATILATARMGVVLFDRTTAILAALFLAVAPFAVRDAHYIKHDVPVTLIIVLAETAAALLIVHGRKRAHTWPWLIAGGLVGLAASTHYYAVFLTVPVAFAALAGAPSEAWARRVRHAAIAGAAALVMFAAGSPFFLLEPGRVWGDIVANRAIVMDRAVATSGTFGSAWRYAEMLAKEAVGWPVFLLALAGGGLALARDWRRAMVWLLFPAVFAAFLANTVPAGRYLNPILPAVALAAAYALRRMTTSLSRPFVAAALLGVIAAAPAIHDSLRVGEFLRQTDTRTLASTFIQRHIAADTGILIQPYSVLLRPSRDSLIRALRAHFGSEERATPRFTNQLALTPYPAPAYDLLWLGDGGLDNDKIYVSPSAFTPATGLSPLKERQVKYVVLNQARGTIPAFRDFERALETDGMLLSRFVPWHANGLEEDGPVEPFLHNTDRRIDARLARPGPVVEIWEVR